MRRRTTSEGWATTQRQTSIISWRERVRTDKRVRPLIRFTLDWTSVPTTAFRIPNTCVDPSCSALLNRDGPVQLKRRGFLRLPSPRLPFIGSWWTAHTNHGKLLFFSLSSYGCDEYFHLQKVRKRFLPSFFFFFLRCRRILEPNGRRIPSSESTDAQARRGYLWHYGANCASEILFCLCRNLFSLTSPAKLYWS